MTESTIITTGIAPLTTTTKNIILLVTQLLDVLFAGRTLGFRKVVERHAFRERAASQSEAGLYEIVHPLYGAVGYATQLR